eukprot:3792766-Rhodomonas_salina.2
MSKGSNKSTDWAQGSTKTLGEGLKPFHGAVDSAPMRTRSIGDKSWRSSGSFSSTVSSRSSGNLSECFAHEGPIQQSAASLESPSRARQTRDVELSNGEGICRNVLLLDAAQHTPQSCQKDRDSQTPRSQVESDTPRSQADTASQADTDPGPVRRFTVFEGTTCNAEIVFAPSQPLSSPADDPEPEPSKPASDFCTGIKWFVRNNKLVVAGFSKWSLADKIGVKHGDILRSVDGVDVLSLTRDEDEDDEDEDGQHPAMGMLDGPYASTCELTMMRVDPDQVKKMMERAQNGQPSFSKEKLMLQNVTFSVPRLIRGDIGAPF